MPLNLNSRKVLTGFSAVIFPYILLTPFTTKKEVHTLVLGGSICNSMCVVPMHNLFDEAGYLN